MHQDLPVAIVKNWKELTKEFLEQKLEEFKNRTFHMKKIYFGYWKNLIKIRIIQKFYHIDLRASRYTFFYNLTIKRNIGE